MEHILIKKMTPAEYAGGGKNLSIRYSFSKSPFGKMLIASTSEGITYMAFADDETEAVKKMKTQFPNAQYEEVHLSIHGVAAHCFSKENNNQAHLVLHLKGTIFQMEVWEKLLQIPYGKLATYADIARMLGIPKACRAVGSAVGKNPVAYIIPCHRIVRSDGNIGGYMWGSERKKNIIEWEKD